MSKTLKPKEAAARSLVSSPVQCFIERNPLLTPFTDGVSSAVTSGRKNPLWFGVSKRLARVREQAGISMLAASKLAGLTASGWRYIEIDERVPLINTVEKIALSLGVPACWLAVRKLLEWNGCECECEHHWEDHDDDCDRCLACRIGEAVGK